MNGGWSAWGACVNNSQSRTCTNPSPSCGGAACTGSSTQSCGTIACSSDAQCNDNNACTTDTCQNAGTYSSYCTNTVSGVHSACSGQACSSVANTAAACTNSCSSNSDCGGCASNAGQTCNDNNSCTTGETIQCNGTTCSGGVNNPVNGGWTTWSGWSACSSCSQSRTRTCTNPTPACGGSTCSGSASDTQACGVTNGGWSAWGACVNNSQSRTCTNPSPSCGGAACTGSSTQSCGTIACSSDAQCNDSNACTTDTCQNAGTYSSYCANTVPGKHSACSGQACVAVANTAAACTNSCTANLDCSISLPPSVNVDLPAAGSTVSGTIQIAGWAIDNTTRVETAISAVKIYVDGNFVANATYGIARPDVCNSYPGRQGCPNVGWNYVWDSRSVANGSHIIRIDATDFDSAPKTTSVSVSVSVNNPLLPPSCTSAAPSFPSTTAVSGSFDVFAYGVQNATSVVFPTWGDVGGQDDIVWYPGSNLGGGTWKASINLSAHKVGNPEYGNLNVHVYMNNSSFSNQFCGFANFVRIAPKPTISLSPTTFTFSGISGGATPSGQTLTITNSGSASLNWTGSLSQTWCHLSPSSGSIGAGASQNITVSVDAPSNLGSFGCTVSIADANATNSPQAASVTYTVAAAPKPTISLSPTTFTFSGISGGATPSGQTLTITNSGSASLNWTGSLSQTWCHLSPSSGAIAAGASQNTTVSVDAPANAGSLPCSITITDPNATNSPRAAMANYTVSPSDVSAVSATLAACPARSVSLAWAAAQSGASPKTYTIYRHTANASGAATAIASGVAVTAFTDTPPVPGGYFYWVEVSAGGLLSPSRVASASNPVSVTACPSPGLSVAPAAFSFTGISGGSAPPGQNLTIGNTTAGTTLLWKATTDKDWCFVDGKSNGQYATGAEANTTGSSHAITVSAPSNLGSFSCTVTVSDNNSSPAPVGSPKTVSVTYAVASLPPPTGVDATNTGAGVVCGQAQVTWTDNSVGEQGFYVYRSRNNDPASASLAGTVVSTSSGTTGTGYSYLDTVPQNSAAYYYWVAAYAGSSESGRVAAAAGSLYISNCEANLNTSDKDIVSVNGTAYPASTCLNNGEFPHSVQFRRDDTVGFNVNLCNQASVSGGKEASDIIIRDTLYNLVRVDKKKALTAPAAWKASVTGGLGIASITVVSGTEAKDLTLEIRLTGTLAPQHSATLSLSGKTDFPAGFSGTSSRFQNLASISYVKDGAGTRATVPTKSIPFLLFVDNSPAPIKTEVGP